MNPFENANARPAGAELREIIAQELRGFLTDVDFSKADQPQDLRIKRIRLDGNAGISADQSTISSEYPSGLRVNFPFKSVYVAEASDAQAKVHFIPGTTNAPMNTGLTQDAVPMSLKDSLHLDRAQASALIVWPSQPGKWVTLVFAVNSKIWTGSQVQLVAGGVTVTNGSSIFSAPFGAMGSSASFPVPASNTMLIPANANRKVVRFRVSGGDIRVGDASTTLLPSPTGLLLEDGDYYEHRNTGPLYGLAAAGSPVLTGTEET